MMAKVSLRVKSLRGMEVVSSRHFDTERDCRERASTNMQLLSDVCDLTVPTAALGYLDLDDGIVGLAGTASSLIGVWTTWKKTA